MKKEIGIILVFALIVRLALVLYSPAIPHEDFHDYNVLALKFYNGLGLSTSVGPTAFRAPGYPTFLGLGYTLFGPSLIVAKILNVGLGVVTVYMTFLLARRVFNPQIACISAIIVACMPSLILYTPILASENLVIPFMLIATYNLVRAFDTNQGRYMIFAGIAASLGALTRPGALLLPAALLVVAIFMKKVNWQDFIRLTAVLLVAMLITHTPWAIRNYRAFGEPVLLTTNGGFNLAMGFNEASDGLYMGGITEIIVGSPFNWNTYRVESGLSETELDKTLKKYAIEYIKSHPFRSMMLVFPKLRYYFQDDVSGVYHNIVITSGTTPIWLWKGLRIVAQLYYMLIMALALFLFVMLRRSLFKQYPASVFVLMPILYWTALHGIFFGGDRFHLPILPFTAVLSAASLVFIWHSNHKRITGLLHSSPNTKQFII